MKKEIAILSFTERGLALARKMRDVLSEDNIVSLYVKGEFMYGRCGDAVFIEDSLHDWCAEVFSRATLIIFIGAAGIAVRTIAPFLASKTEDPAVIVADESGRHIISLLSGHAGGGNDRTRYLAERLGADPVITTASDISGKLAIDVWAQKNHLYLTDAEAAKRIAARIVNGERVPFYCEGRVIGQIPPELIWMNSNSETERRKGAVIVSVREEIAEDERTERNFHAHASASSCFEKDSMRKTENLLLVPRAVILGVGCKKGKPFPEIRDFVYRLLREQRVSPKSICCIASIDLKSEEEGLIRLAEEFSVQFQTFPAETLRLVPGEYSASEFVRERTGADNVCERAAMAALAPEEQKKAHFICRKTAGGGVTAALLERDWEVFFE
ncbi:MAG: cobalt-precorrin 5A hydrolase [Clostridiales bacterium]|nr:cobalt-precorrin 5A hydrolase [Clostridiales bacterium]